LAASHGTTRQNAQRARTVTEIVKDTVGAIGRVVGKLLVDVVALFAQAQECRSGRMVGIESGVEMRDPNALAER
jgi:hypothetical protein